MIVLRVPTEIGAIEFRRAGARRSGGFWWRWVTGDTWNGPFEQLIDCLSDATAAYELAVDVVRAEAARRRPGSGLA